MYKFKVGDPVMVKKAIKFGGLNTLGICGCVGMTDVKAGICVALCISRIYRPSFWYPEDVLAAVDESKGWREEMYVRDIEEALGGRPCNICDPVIIQRGCLRSWMLAMVNPPPGHMLENLIKELGFNEVLDIYGDGTGRLFSQWVSENDTRVRRPRITKSDGEVAAGIIGIPRTKITGRK